MSCLNLGNVPKLSIEILQNIQHEILQNVQLFMLTMPPSIYMSYLNLGNTYMMSYLNFKIR